MVCVVLGAGRGIKPHLRRRRTALRINRGLRLRRRVEALSCLRSCSIPLRESEADWKTEKKVNSGNENIQKLKIQHKNP